MAIIITQIKWNCVTVQLNEDLLFGPRPENAGKTKPQTK